MTSPLALAIAFRRGWQYQFTEGDTLRVYRARDRWLLAELPAHVVGALVEHYLRAAALQAEVVAHLGPIPLPTVLAPDPLPPAKAWPRLPAAKGRRLRGRAS